ncbi:MAG: hypothetical protein EU543_02735 [Promethearchaeota archaeon]|nr:MAG: hypothetical protein EU543_02735 [Candidatus Lokiarchaeota archaeon]
MVFIYGLILSMQIIIAKFVNDQHEISDFKDILKKNIKKILKMKKRNKKIYFFLSSICILLTFGIIIQATHSSRVTINNSANLSNINVDGVIEEGEWLNTDINKSFYLDVNNTADLEGDINVDGNNTIYIGQDAQNIYMALDLCGDRSNLSAGEWVGVWFNFNNRSFENYFDWFNYLGNGTESLIHDVDNDKIWPYYTPVLNDYYEDFRNDESYSLINGFSESDYTHFLSYTGKDFNITSELIESNYKYRMDFSFKISDIAILPNSSEVLDEFKIRIQSFSNISIDNNKLAIWNGENFPDLGNSDQVKDINTGTSLIFDTINYGLGNLTDDNEIKFSILGNNSAAFKYSIHSLRFIIISNETTNAGGIDYPYTSLINEDVKWSFGPSPENATDHRMFEIRIAKSEFTQYDPNKGIGIIVGGYGTLSFPDTNYWVLSKNEDDFTIENSEDYIYIDLTWSNEDSPPDNSISSFNIFIILSLIGILSLVFYNKYE